MKDFISANVKSIEISGIRKFYNLVSKHPGAVSLTIGQPDFNIPGEVEIEIINSVKRGETKYTANSGIESLRNQISGYLKKLNIDFMEDEIIVTVGGSEGLYSSMTAVIDPGDYVLIPEIAYPAYENITKILGGRIIYYKLNEDFSVNIGHMEEQINKYSPKLMILSFPSNPTGAVLSKNDRDSIYKIIKEKDLLVLSDEIYAALCFSDFYSVSQYADIKDNIILVGGFSKMFSMTGLRLGFVAASEYIINSILKVHQYNVSCAPSIIQYGAVEGLKNSSDFVEKMKKEFMVRRDFVYDSLLHMGLDVIKPEGAFYIFPSISKFNMSSFDFAFNLLDKKNLAVVPGSAFSGGGEGFIRISYASSMEDLKVGMERLSEFIKTINNG